MNYPKYQSGCKPNIGSHETIISGTDVSGLPGKAVLANCMTHLCSNTSLISHLFAILGFNFMYWCCHFAKTAKPPDVGATVHIQKPLDCRGMARTKLGS